MRRSFAKLSFPIALEKNRGTGCNLFVPSISLHTCLVPDSIMYKTHEQLNDISLSYLCYSIVSRDHMGAYVSE